MNPRQPEYNEPWAKKTTNLVQSSRLHRRPRVSLKTINIIVEDEHEEENEEQMWFDPDEFDCHDPSFFSARGRMEEVLKMDVDYDDTEEGNSSRSDLTSALGRPQKRIIWGEEVPLTATIGERHFPDESFGPSSYVMTMGVNPLITIRPVLKGDETGGLAVSKDEAIIFNPNSASGIVPSHRVLELDQLRNYFQLTAPESGSYGLDSVYQVKSRFFLSLLDPSMPRLTNCGNYYRMRYAVYVMPKRAANRSMFQGNWRNRAAGRGYTTARADYEQPEQEEDGDHASGGKVLHIGEMHLYTIFPKDGGKQRVSGGREWIPQWCLERPDYIHYENISFFLNQTPLSGKEQSALRVTENDVNQMVQHFRRFLKHLNSTYVSSTVSAAITNPHEVNYNSTFLLEQLKYPKAGEHFTNPDRVCEQFVRNQMDMFARYQVNFREQAEVAAAVANLVSSEVPDSQMATACPIASEVYPKETAASKDCLTMDLFLAKLHRLRNQAEWKSVEA